MTVVETPHETEIGSGGDKLYKLVHFVSTKFVLNIVNYFYFYLKKINATLKKSFVDRQCQGSNLGSHTRPSLVTL